MPSSRAEKAAPARWTAWQAARRAQGVLSARAAAQDYTALQVQPPLRATFFVMLDLLSARHKWLQRLARLHADPAFTASLEEVEVAWQRWEQWTRHFAATLTHLTADHPTGLPLEEDPPDAD